MKGYSPSTELLNLYDTVREKPFEFMHSRSFVNINVATGWTVSQGGQFPYENVITLPVDEGDFPITMEYQPTAIIQPNANESCAPSNFPYIETTRQNQVTLYAYSIPSPTSMLPIVINLTQNGSPYGSTNAAAQRSTVEQTMIQLSQNYFLVEVVDEVLVKNTTITFNVTAYKGGESVSITPADNQPEYAIINQDGDPIQNPSGGTYPSVAVEAIGDKSVKVTVNLLKDTFIKNGVAIIQFPVQAGGVFYPRATINAITSTAILEQVDSYDLSFGTLTRSSSGDFFVDGKPLSANNKWIINATKRTLNGVVSSVSSGTIKFIDVENNESYSRSLSNSQVVLEEELRINSVFEARKIRIDLEIGGKVVESKFINIIVSVFSTLIQPSVEYIISGSTNNIRFSSFTLLQGGTIVPKYGTLTIYKNSVNEESKLISEDNVNEINYSLIPTESFNPLEGVGSFIATFAETIGGAVSQQRVIPVVGGTGEPDIFSLVASPVVLMVDVDKNYELKSNPVSTLKVYRNGSDVTNGFKFSAVSDGGEDFTFNLDSDNNQLTVTKFAAGASQIVGVTITAENRDNPNIQAIGSLQAIRQMEEEIISYYTYIRYTADKTNPDLETYPLTIEIEEGKSKWMGVVITTTPTAPTDKGEYNWTPVAEDGRGIESTEVSYGQSSSETEKPTSWGALPESLIQGNYLWTKTIITYTDGTDTEMYSVSYIAIDGPKGDPGERGPKGDDGYTPIKGVDYFDGVDGQDGKGITSAVVTYQNHTNGTTAPTGTWTENPNPIKGQYLWTRTVTTYTDTTSVPTYSVAYQAIDGTDGTDGTDGRGIVSTVVEYVKSTTATMPGTGWSTNRPTVNKGEFLWTRTTINYTSGSPSVAISNSYVPTDGQNGTSAFLWVRYSQNADGNPMSTNPVGAEYIGIATTATDEEEPDSHTLYNWSLIKGEQGVPGETGQDGQTSYLHIKYSNDGGTTFTANNGETVGDWIGTYVDFTEEDSDQVIDYTWNKVKGEQGEQGADAKLLYLSASAEAMTFNSDNTPNPATQTITFTANMQNTTGTATFTATPYNGTTALTNITLGGSGNTRTLTQAQFPSTATRIQITAILSGLSDTVSIVKLKNGDDGADGKNAIVGYLTNENVTFPANSSGVVTSANLVMANGVFKVFDGLTDKTGSGVDYSVVSKTGANGAITTTGAYSVSAITTDNAAITFRAIYSGVTIDKVLTLSKSKEGADGEDGEPTYTWIKYADTPTSGMDDFPDGKKYIGLAFNKTTQTGSANYNDYQWSLMPQNIEIGGRNYFVRILINNIGEATNVLRSGINWKGYSFRVNEGEEYTIHRSHITNNRWRLYWVYTDEVEESTTYTTAFSADSQPSHVPNTVKVPTGTKWGHLFLSNDDSDGSTIPKIMIERGSTLTDWTPAPEDVQADLHKIEQTIENVRENSVTTSEFEREKNLISTSVTEVITTTGELVTRVDGLKTETEELVLKQEALTSELELTSTNIRAEVEAISTSGDERFAALELKSDSIESEVGNLSGDISDLSTKVTQTEDRITQAVMGETSSLVEQKTSSITSKVTSVEADLTKAEGQIKKIETFFRIDGDGIALGKSDNKIEFYAEPDEIGFRQTGIDGEEKGKIAYWKEGTMHVDHLIAIMTILVGNHHIEKYESPIAGDSTVIRRRGGGDT